MSNILFLIYTRDPKLRQRIPLKNNDETMVTMVKKSLEKGCDVSHLHRYGLLLKNTQKTRDTFEFLAKTYKEETNLLKFKALNSKLNEGEEFYIIYADKATYVERKIAIESLRYMRENTIPAVFYNKIFSYYNQQSFDFDIYSFGFDNLPVFVGDTDRNLRTCRFCGATGRDCFKDEAHAIQESLGNKLLICYEECDNCNHALNTIEDNFLYLMDVRRALFGIRRKENNKCPNIIGRNYVIRPDAIGKPEVFIMKEDVAPEVDMKQPFLYEFIHKRFVTNENVYKALIKMVIDLIPSKYLPELHNTIEWVKAVDGSWFADTLPSFLVAELPNEIFHKQPVVDLFIRKKDDGDTPYCTAILWICDLAYMFVVPLVDCDSGRFKKDVNLSNHWHKMASWYRLLWRVQNTSEWQNAKVWVHWLVDPSDSAFHILSKSDSVFDESRKVKAMYNEVMFPPVNVADVYIKRIKANFKNHYHGVRLSNTDLIDLTQRMTKLRFVFDPKHSTVKLLMKADVYNQQNTELWFSYDFNVVFGIKHFRRSISLTYTKSGEVKSFAIDVNLCRYLFNKCLIVCESRLSVKRKGTNFESADITKLKAEIERILERSLYLVPLHKGYFEISDRKIHSKMYEN